MGLNTEPSLPSAAIESGTDSVLVVMSADQTVATSDIFTSPMGRAVSEDAIESIVILSVTPDNPEPSYRYIQNNRAGANVGSQAIRSFVE